MEPIYQEPTILPTPVIQQPTRPENILGMRKTVSSAPTGTPQNWFDQIQIYTNGTTYRLYWYDATNSTWHYVTATA